MDGLLSAATVGDYLTARGLLEPGTPVTARELGGGVSNVVLAVEAGGLRCVVKRSLPRLRVAEEWLAPRERALTEAAALRLAAALTPGAVPDVLDADPDACALVVSLAPDGWRTWKELLLAGHADVTIAGRLGEVLARWHAATFASDPGIGSTEAFDALRVDPYLRTVARRHPDLATPVLAWAERLLSRPRCLVHGDFSPKNVLVGDGGLWVIDAEVAHRGDPVFDLAFLLSHLLLKTLYRPAAAARYAECGERFWSAYRAGAPGALAPDAADVLSLAGCLLVARVDGKSPAEYLDGAERGRARERGGGLVLDPPGTLAGAWERIGS